MLIKDNTGRSWFESAQASNGFGLTHLPYGAFERPDGVRRVCVRLGEFALDLEACERHALLDPLPRPVQVACTRGDLHELLALGHEAWRALRSLLLTLVNEPEGYLRSMGEFLFEPLSEVQIVAPIRPRGYVDFYASEDHARRVGELFRPEQPLLPNYRHVPIAYNGRASSLVLSGTPVQRPWGQRRAGDAPVFTPTAALDYELELGFVAGGSNALGEPVPVAHAAERLFGVVLLNDWSARDVQAWEYQPLGPFLGKSFATTISPWITPLEALASCRVPAAPRETAALPYLVDEADQRGGAFDLALRVELTTAASRAAGLAPFVLSEASPRGLCWTPAQMVAHMTSNGCPLEPGDILATGTVSGAARPQAGCLLELTRNGADPISLPNGERRAWLEDGDEITLRGACGEIALAECSGRVVQRQSSGSI